VSWDAGENVDEYAWDIEHNIRNNVRNAAVVEGSADATRRGKDLNPVEENADFEEYHHEAVDNGAYVDTLGILEILSQSAMVQNHTLSRGGVSFIRISHWCTNPPGKTKSTTSIYTNPAYSPYANQVRQ
jgi:hypothetical protein